MKLQRVGDYLLGEKLGEGSFAKVRVGLHVMSREKVSNFKFLEANQPSFFFILTRFKCIRVSVPNK